MNRLNLKSKKIEREVLENYKINSPSKLPLENKKILGFSDYQVLVILPNTKKEYLGWHQDSRYFSYSHKKSSNIISWTPIFITNKNATASLDIIKESHKIGVLHHNENLHKTRKSVSLQKRGRFYISENDIDLKKKININVNTGKSLVFDANIVHRTPT